MLLVNQEGGGIFGRNLSVSLICATTKNVLRSSPLWGEKVYSVPQECRYAKSNEQELSILTLGSANYAQRSRCKRCGTGSSLICLLKTVLCIPKPGGWQPLCLVGNAPLAECGYNNLSIICLQPFWKEQRGKKVAWTMCCAISRWLQATHNGNCLCFHLGG